MRTAVFAGRKLPRPVSPLASGNRAGSFSRPACPHTCQSVPAARPVPVPRRPSPCPRWPFFRPAPPAPCPAAALTVLSYVFATPRHAGFRRFHAPRPPARACNLTPAPCKCCSSCRACPSWPARHLSVSRCRHTASCRTGCPRRSPPPWSVPRWSRAPCQSVPSQSAAARC